MNYEINVSKNGKHLFATHERSLRGEDEAKELYALFLTKFPASEGYYVRVSRQEHVGYDVTEEMTGETP